jgi:hypothetical protein
MYVLLSLAELVIVIHKERKPVAFALIQYRPDVPVNQETGCVDRTDDYL